MMHNVDLLRQANEAPCWKYWTFRADERCETCGHDKRSHEEKFRDSADYE